MFDIFAFLAFIIMGYLKTASRRPYNKDLKTENILKYDYQLERYNVLKCEIRAILFLKIT